jgi:hypothetical protein
MRKITARRLIITMAVIQLIGIATLLAVSLQGMNSLPAPVAVEAGQKAPPTLRNVIIPLGIIAPLAFSFTIIPILVIAVRELPGGKRAEMDAEPQAA